MRISKGRGWLAVAAAWALGTVRADLVTFSPTQAAFQGDSPGQAIFTLEEFYGRVFVYNVSGVTVDNIFLCANDSGGPRQIGWAPVGQLEQVPGAPPAQPTTMTPTTTSPSTDFPPQPATPSSQGKLSGGSRQHNARGTSELRLSVIAYGNSAGGVYLNGADEPYDRLAHAVYNGIPLFFQTTGSYGESYSRLFTLVNDTATLDAFARNTTIFTDLSHKPEQTASTSPKSPATSSVIPDATTGGGGQSDGNLGTSGGATSQTSGGAASQTAGSSGLSTGAIIGIAVACGVVGLLLVAAAVWYLLRRRQQHQALLDAGGDGAPYGPGSSKSKNRRAETLMAEKEAGADVDVSPHSPYSDDGASGGGPGPSGVAYPDGSSYVGAEAAVAAGAAVGAAGAGLHHHHYQQQQQQQQQHPQDQHASRSYTPYSDRPSAGGATGTPSIRAASLAPAQTDETPRVSVPSTTPGRATPRALTTPYAHLVEEGMTEDEIRRLEEEERQLDAAIEQAGRR